jgi:hypothetical protein
MGVIDDLADALARDTIATADELADEGLIKQIGDQLGASSSTMQEAYLTSIRVRLAEKRARQFLEAQRARHVEGTAADSPPGLPE